jgi:prolyl oligopeptidase
MNTVAQGGTIEVIHGIEVRDPYRWLEDRQLPDTEDWISRQRRLCDQYFMQNGICAPLKQIVIDTLAVEVIDQAARVGERVILRKQARGQEQAAIWLRSDEDSEDTLLVDPTAFGTNISISILRSSPDGSLLAYGVRASGSDAMETHIVDIATGATLPDHLPLSYLRGFAFDVESKGFYYCADPVERAVRLSIKYHHFGEACSSDLPLFSTPWAEHRRLVLLANRGVLAAVVTGLAGAEMVQDLYLSAESNNTSWTAMYRGMRGRRWPILAEGRVFLLDFERTRNGSLLEQRNADELPRVIVPEGSNVIQTCLVVQQGFLVCYLVNRQPRIERWSIEGECIGVIALPPGGSVEVLPLCSERGASVFFLHESYTKAPSLWEIYLSEEHSSDPIRWTKSDEGSSATTRECWYTSRDGTQVPMVLLEPAKKRLSGPQPVILSAYGGFGAAEVPRYSRFAKIMTELGVTIARPSIRGGSDFGQEWHRAATKRLKQTAIDDFLAAADWLLCKGITDQQQLAIMGGSNGGLLVAAAVIQRPDMFKAVVCTGPLTDMVRYERFDHASRWRAEYGTVEDPEDFGALFSYSPYHNVKDNVNYPAMLFVTGDADDRCNPAHVRKMAASLQERGAQQHPIIVDYGEHWGHVPTLSITERVEALYRKIAFLCEQLGITLPEEVAGDLLGY